MREPDGLAALRPDLSLASLNDGVGVRNGQRPVDVLLVGVQSGVFKTINPIGDPADGDDYPQTAPDQIFTATLVSTNGKTWTLMPMSFQAEDS